MIGILILKGKSCSNADTLDYKEFENEKDADSFIKDNETKIWFDDHFKCWQYEKYWTRCIKVKNGMSLDLYRDYLFKEKESE